MSKKQTRKKYSCDFETTTDVNDCRVWAYGWVEIGNESNRGMGTSMSEFMEWALNVNADIYFHNLKFDGSFIVNYLLRNGYEWSKSEEPGTFHTIISKMGQWYKISITIGYKGKKKIHTQIFDSLKKLPFSVKKIGKDFKLPVLKIEQEEEFYERPRPIGHTLTQEEIDYLNNDVDVIAKALEIQFEQGLTKMTAGADSLAEYKQVIGEKKFDKLFPVFNLKVNTVFRKAYKGGFTWLNPIYQEKEINQNGMIFDVNSLYPSVMYNRLLPYGTPISFKGRYKKNGQYPLYIQLVQTGFTIKDDHIPTIQIKKDTTGMFKSNEYQTSSKGERPVLYLTNVDLELIEEHYELIDPVFIGGWMFRGQTGLFCDFIDKWMHIKKTSDGAIKNLAKLMLNSLYGKFSTNPDVTGKIPVLKEDGETLRFEEGETEFKDPVYTPMGAFITAYARDFTIRTAQSVYERIIYCDTDSIHILGTEIPDSIKDIIHDDELGYWAHESTFKRAKYLRQKTYVNELYKKYIIKNGEKVSINASPDDYDHLELSVKCAGMTDKIKKEVTFENFRIGFKSDKQKKPKQVPGGVVLVPSPFEIKESGSWRFM